MGTTHRALGGYQLQGQQLASGKCAITKAEMGNSSISVTMVIERNYIRRTVPEQGHQLGRSYSPKGDVWSSHGVHRQRL